MCIVMDEVEDNTSQKGYGDNGGESYVCGKNMTPQLKSSTKEEYFTLLGLTTLSGNTVICVVIFAGDREESLYQCGMDIFVEKVGEVSVEVFL